MGKKIPALSVGERAGRRTTVPVDPAIRSSCPYASDGCGRAGPVSRGEAAHAHAAAHHLDACEAHLRVLVGSWRMNPRLQLPKVAARLPHQHRTDLRLPTSPR